MQEILRHFPTLVLGFIVYSCSGEPLDVDVSDIEVQIEFVRVEQKLAEAKSVADIKTVNRDLINSCGELYEFYMYELLQVPVEHDSIGEYLWYFQTDPVIREVNEDIRKKFEDISGLEDQVVDMFKHLRFHLDSAPVPKQVITYNSAFRFGVTSSDQQVGIGLDMYLGGSNRNIAQLVEFPQYMKAKMDEEYLPVDIAHSWIINNILNGQPGETFLSYMVHYGKLLYVVDAMLPDLADHLKIRYTQSEYEFGIVSEFDIWEFLVDMDWIYSSEIKVLMRYFHDAPTTVDIEGSPDRIGQFMGWQMVRQYMEKNPEVTVSDLVEETNESKILKAYKPEPYE